MVNFPKVLVQKRNFWKVKHAMLFVRQCIVLRIKNDDTNISVVYVIVEVHVDSQLRIVEVRSRNYRGVGQW